VLRPLCCLAAVLTFTGPVLAADLPSLPTFAQDPNAAAPDYWKGFYVGAGVSGFAGKGVKGAWGAVSFAGYDRVFSNGITLGVQVDAGYNPWLTPRGGKGFDFAQTEVKLGYQMGKLTPFVTSGVALSKETRFSPGLNSAAAVNSLFADPGALRASGVMGVGVDYQVTDKLSIGVSAYVNNSGGLAR